MSIYQLDFIMIASRKLFIIVAVFTILALANVSLVLADRPSAYQNLSDLRITEIMYHPMDVDALDGDSLEYIELKNVGGTAVNLSGFAFIDGISYSFASGDMLQPGQFLVLAANAAEFENHYGFAPFGDYDGRLDNSGEQVVLSDGAGSIVIDYSDRHPWPLSADGVGFSLVLKNQAPGVDVSDPANWNVGQFGGSPAVEEPVMIEVPAIVVNEVLTHTDPPFKDAVELFNPIDTAVNIGGWFLTDDKLDPRKYQIPANTLIPGSGYLVFDEDDFNTLPGAPGSFALSSFGDGIFLISANAQGELTGYVRGFTFGGAENGVTFGRELWVSGAEELLPQKSETLGRENSGARIGPIVITEMMYNPAIGQEEFIELVNISSQSISLFDQQFPENVWQISGVGYSFPANTTLGPGDVALVVGIEPAVFRANHSVPADVMIMGPYTGMLNNAGESIALQAPEDPDTDGTVPFYNIDHVEYNDNNPWPESADGEGASLAKINLDGLSNDPANWQALANGGSPGVVDLGSVSTEEELASVTGFELAAIYPNPFSQEATTSFSVDKPGHVRIKLYDVLGREAASLFDGHVGSAEQKSLKISRAGLPGGVYFLTLEVDAGPTRLVRFHLGGSAAIAEIRICPIY